MAYKLQRSWFSILAILAKWTFLWVFPYPTPRYLSSLTERLIKALDNEIVYLFETMEPNNIRFVGRKGHLLIIYEFTAAIHDSWIQMTKVLLDRVEPLLPRKNDGDIEPHLYLNYHHRRYLITTIWFGVARLFFYHIFLFPAFSLVLFRSILRMVSLLFLELFFI